MNPQTIEELVELCNARHIEIVHRFPVGAKRWHVCTMDDKGIYCGFYWTPNEVSWDRVIDTGRK